MGPSTLEVNVVTYTGSKKVYVDPVWTFEQLKLELHEHLASLRIPPPLSQKLVCPGGVEPLDSSSVGSLVRPNDDVVVLPRRDSAPAAVGLTCTAPIPTLADINRAIQNDKEASTTAVDSLLAATPAAAGAPAAQQPRPGGEDALRSMVEGNFEELRGYLEQLQEVMVQNGMPGSAAFEFALPDSFSEEGDGANGEEEDDGDDAEDSESEEDSESGDEQYPALEPIRIPEVEEAPLAELLTMGFPEQLSRNALLLHRNRLAAAVDWALSHVDDDAAAEPLSQEVLAAVYGPPQQLAAGAARRRQRRAVEADLEALQSMMSIGFDADQARDALVLSNNNLDEACRLLLLTSELARVSEGLQGFAGAGGGAQEAGRDSPPPLHDEEESEDGSEEGGEESSEEEMWHSGTEDSGEQSSSEEERAREGD